MSPEPECPVCATNDALQEASDTIQEWKEQMDALWRMTFRPRGFVPTTLDLREVARSGEGAPFPVYEADAVIRRARRMDWELYPAGRGWSWWKGAAGPAYMEGITFATRYASRRLAAHAFARGLVDARVGKP